MLTTAINCWIEFSVMSTAQEAIKGEHRVAVKKSQCCWSCGQWANGGHVTQTGVFRALHKCPFVLKQVRSEQVSLSNTVLNVRTPRNELNGLRLFDFVSTNRFSARPLLNKSCDITHDMHDIAVRGVLRLSLVL